MSKTGQKQGASQPKIYTFPAPAYQEFGRMYVLESFSLLMGQVFKQIGKTLDGQAPLLFRGESGTGKEVFARIVHGAHQQRQGRFVVVECQAPSEEQLDKELWGPNNGTGAAAEDWGKLGEADGGTIFLKNVEALPPALQLRILQMLQEKILYHPETGETKKISVRVLASTKTNLEIEAAERRFRQDLYYRLTVHQYDLPPLRERKQDIAKFADHFASKFAVNAGGERFSFTPTVLGLLQAYDWPGNIRELRQVILRSVIRKGEGLSLINQIHWADTNGNGSLPHETAHALEPPETDNSIDKSIIEHTSVPSHSLHQARRHHHGF